MHAFCSPQKDSRFTWVGLLAWRGQCCWLSPLTVCRFTFPSNTLSGCLEATGPHLQWRNRAGLAPDFPVMPVVGTRGADGYITVLVGRARLPFAFYRAPTVETTA